MLHLKCPECRKPLIPTEQVCSCGFQLKITDGVVELYSYSFRRRLENFLLDYDRVYRAENATISEDELTRSPFVYSGPLKKDWAYRRRSLDVLRPQLSINKKLSVLEIGPWNGWLSKQIIEAGHRLVAVDYFRTPPYGLQTYKSDSPEHTKIQLDLLDLSLLDEKFDLLILNHCLQFFPDPIAYIEQCIQKLNKEGKLFIIGSPIYHASVKKASQIQKQKIYYKENYNFDLFFQAGKGYLDSSDLREMIKSGVQFHSYPGSWLKNLVAEINPSRAKYLFGTYLHC